jgi:hypothetical protein
MAAPRTATPAKSTPPAATPTPVVPANGTEPAAQMPITPTAPVAPVASIRFDAQTLTKIKSAGAWRPKDGETLEGTIITVVRRTGEFGPYPCVILNTGNVNKFIAVHAFHGVLQNELREMKAKPGDNITVLYTGKRTANKLNADGSEKNYHGYSVVPTDGGELEVFDFTADAD